MSFIKGLILFLGVIVAAFLLWIFLPVSSHDLSFKVSTGVFEQQSWQNLAPPVYVVPEKNYGRANPFASYASVDNEVERDEIRLKIIDETRAGLQRFYDARGIYPVGQSIEIGSTNAACLSALGWVSEKACAVPANPAANIQYARDLQIDPGLFSIIYSRDNDDGYLLSFVLETDEFLGQSGTYIANEEGIRRQK